MDSVYDLDTAVSLLILIIYIVINRYQRCLPVIAVYYIRSKLYILQHFKNCSVKKDESLTVVIEAVKTVS